VTLTYEAALIVKATNQSYIHENVRGKHCSSPGPEKASSLKEGASCKIQDLMSILEMMIENMPGRNFGQPRRLRLESELLTAPAGDDGYIVTTGEMPDLMDLGHRVG
jgi:hypothetical protein